MPTQQNINAIRAQRLANTHDPLALMANTQTPFHPDHSSLITNIKHPQPNNNFVPQPSFNTNYLQHPMQNLKDISNPTAALDMALEFMSKEFHLNNTTSTNNNQKSLLNPCYSQIAQSGIANQHGNGNVVVAQTEGNSNGINGNQIRCYNCRGEGQYASNCIVKPRKRDAAYLQTQLQTVQKKEAGIQLNYEEFDFMAAAGAYNEIEENDSNVTSAVSSMEQGEGTIEQHPINVEETRAYFESLYNNLAIEVERSTRQEKYDKLERCYQKSVYQEQCLTKKINSLHLSFGKQITTLNEEISNLNDQLPKEKSTVSSLLEEKKKLKSDFKIREDELLDKQIQLENKIKELDNILVKMGQSIQMMHMLSPKRDSFYHTEQKIALGYQNPFYLKQAQQKQQILYNGKVLLENHDPPAVYDSEETLELAQESRQKIKQLNKEIKSSSSVHQEIHKIIKDEIFPIVNQVDARVQSFEIQFLKEAAKFVRDFKSLAEEDDESIAKYKALELIIECLLRAVVSQDIMSVMQNNYVVDTSNLKTELERMKERFENCIIKKK
nr:hypothetical protein [Tanacetum cinerariifolium]